MMVMTMVVRTAMVAIDNGAGSGDMDDDSFIGVVV